MEERIRVGVVGYGFVAQTWHIPFILHHKESLDLRFICSTKPPCRVQDEVRKIRKAQHVLDDPDDLPVVLGEYESIFGREDVDLLVLCTPNSLHFEQTQRALLSGKHVVCEKPFTVTEAEAKSLYELAESVKRKLYVFHNRRYDTDFLTIRSILKSEPHSKSCLDGGNPPVLVEYNWHKFRPNVQTRWRDKKSPGSGMWYDLAPHMLDHILQLFGSPLAVKGSLLQSRDGAETDDLDVVILTYPRCLVVLTISALVPPEHMPRWKIHLRDGHLLHKKGMDPQEEQLKNGLYPGVYADYGIDPDPLVCEKDSTRQELNCTRGCEQNFYTAVIDGIRGKGPGPNTKDEVLEICRLIETVHNQSSS